ncbi:AGC/NDR/NDR protein kinase [Capronia epimyces CBS 606.96]|uniref:non-specific serine/threonine protein kinase n=1 Tax=Capronia epimyces CBS 606.96 TaxID=1182542 RepID=W9YU24_9EURO|nr:AGC/NDR/NDR protein kinase [Capronia epimyces CBS 606.96]EXJ93195.1 AGC/NDR/NDR protein kinase [Capronia epimyces CBS 606.96]
MPFINALSRKRRPSSPTRTSTPARWSTPRLTKLPKLDHILFDGTASHSIESTSTGRSKVSVKSQLKRGVSSIKTILGLGDRFSDSSIRHHPEAGFASTQGPRASQVLGNESNVTTVCQPLRLRLTALADMPEGSHDMPESMTCRNFEDADFIPSEWTRSHKLERRNLRRSHSAPGLQRRITQKFQQAFGNPTVVRRSELRSRPSIQTLAFEAAEATSTQPSSNPSTLNSSSSSPIARKTSTPLTSEPVTPKSMGRPGSMNSFDIDRQIYFAEARLTPIPESSTLPPISIKTVESAAAAKVFFEMHFNSLLGGDAPRAVRRRMLELNLREHHLSPNSQYRARKAWERAESENLRQSRVLKNTTNQAKAAQGVAIGGFKVVSVLGKGSFGVVRLVKAKGSQDGSAGSEAVKDKGLELKPSRASLKASVKALPGSIMSKRRELARGRKEVFAMKVIRKSDMIRNGQEGHLRAERDFLVAAEGARWVIPLIAAFQDRKHLYLVMEYCIGGDFLGLLIRRNVLCEEVTKWYIAEMILCVEEAHRMRWIHRDVKPDNFLIAIDGHLKISDFGLAFDGEWTHDQKFYQENRHSLLEQLGIHPEGDEQDRREREEREARPTGPCSSLRGCPQHAREISPFRDEPAMGEPILDWRNRSQRRRLARSVVGTSQYMAPEVIRGEMYDGRCDWWSIAIIMYECLYGFTPFACEDRHQTKLKILQHKKTLVFPETGTVAGPSIEAMDLMMQILVEKEKRLCSRQYELNDFTRKIVRGRVIRCAADKIHQNYQGYFVYSGDAEDIKRHAFFRDIDWDTVHLRRPPFVPRVRDWEDTKYFDEEEPVSDIDTATTIEEGQEVGVGCENLNPQCPQEAQSRPPRVGSSQASQHQPEGQNIVPSMAMKLPHMDCPVLDSTLSVKDSMDDLKNPLLAPRNAEGALTHGGPGITLLENGIQVDGPTETEKIAAQLEVAKAPAKKKEQKRPRDVILRDPIAGAEALEIRKVSAFLGYDYRQPAMVQDIIEQVIAEDNASSRPRDNRFGGDHGDLDLISEKRMFVEAGGQLSPGRRGAGLL